MRKYTKELIKIAVEKSFNWSDVCRNLGVVPRGSMHTHIKNEAIKFGIDCSHFRKYMPLISPRKRPLSDYLVADSNTSAHRIRQRLVKEKTKEEKCENCLLSQWQDKKIPLELHHIDGDTRNNLLENLQILCRNCHAQTDNYGVKKTPSRNHYKSCLHCSGQMHRNSRRCLVCRYREQRGNNGS